MPKRRGRDTGGIVPHGKGKWRASYSLKRGEQKVRGSKVFKIKADAEAWLRDQLSTGPVASGTLGEWVAHWITVHTPNVERKTMHRYQQLLGKHVCPRIGKTRLRDLDAGALRKWLAAMHADGVSDGERHRAGVCLRKVLNDAAVEGKVPNSPMRGVKLPKVGNKEKDALAAPDLRRLVAAGSDPTWDDPAYMDAMVRLWADAGLRPQEIAGLQWGDFVGDEITVRRAVCSITGELKPLKTGRSKRKIPLGPSTVAALGRLTRGADDSPLFPAPKGGHWQLGNLSNRLTGPLFALAGLTGTGYTLRHTMATLLLGSGESLRVVSDRLGHADSAMTLRVYAHALPGDQKRAADRMETILGPSTQDKPTASNHD